MHRRCSAVETSIGKFLFHLLNAPPLAHTENSTSFFPRSPFKPPLMACEVVEVASTLAFGAFGAWGLWIAPELAYTYRGIMITLCGFGVVGAAHHLDPALRWARDGSAVVPALLASSVLVYGASVVGPPLGVAAARLLTAAAHTVQFVLLVASCSVQYPPVPYLALAVALVGTCAAAAFLWSRRGAWPWVSNLHVRLTMCAVAAATSAAAFYWSEVQEVCAVHGLWHVSTAWLLFSLTDTFLALQTSRRRAGCGVVVLDPDASPSADAHA